MKVQGNELLLFNSLSRPLFGCGCYLGVSVWISHWISSVLWQDCREDIW